MDRRLASAEETLSEARDHLAKWQAGLSPGGGTSAERRLTFAVERGEGRVSELRARLRHLLDDPADEMQVARS